MISLRDLNGRLLIEEHIQIKTLEAQIRKTLTAMVQNGGSSPVMSHRMAISNLLM
jgi:hypothetical protein